MAVARVDESLFINGEWRRATGAPVDLFDPTDYPSSLSDLFAISWDYPSKPIVSAIVFPITLPLDQTLYLL